MLYPALLPLMRTARLPVVDWTDAPADLNGLVHFAERRNLVSARVPSHFNWPVLATATMVQTVFICVYNNCNTPHKRRMNSFSWLAFMYTIALTSAHENMVAYTVISECRENSLLRDASGMSATGWFPQPSARFSGQIGTVWKLCHRAECRFNL